MLVVICMEGLKALVRGVNGRAEPQTQAEEGAAVVQVVHISLDEVLHEYRGISKVQYTELKALWYLSVSPTPGSYFRFQVLGGGCKQKKLPNSLTTSADQHSFCIRAAFRIKSAEAASSSFGAKIRNLAD
jgi:hypothetical protein